MFFWARIIVKLLFPRYVVVRYRCWNGSENKGYLSAAILVGRKEGRKEGNCFGDKKEFELDVRRNYASL